MESSTLAFLESRRLLGVLIQMERDGTDQTSEADALRGKMEAPWYAMDEAGRDEIRRLSALGTDNEWPSKSTGKPTTVATHDAQSAGKSRT